MSRAFEVGRSFKLEFEKSTDEVIMGYYDGFYETVTLNDGSHVRVAADVVTFNTGFQDEKHLEIFTGDYVRHAGDDTEYEVIFDKFQGAFYIRARNSFTKQERLTYDSARYLRITGSIYDTMRAFKKRRAMAEELKNGGKANE